MNSVGVRRFSVVLGTLVLAWAAGAHGQEYENDVDKTGVIDRDLFVTGDDVSVRAEVRGDVVAMAEDLSIVSTVSGDVIAMAGHIRLDSAVSGEVFAVAGGIAAEGDAAQGVTLFGGSVTWTGQARGPVLIAGGRILTGGKTVGPVKLLGGKIYQGAIVEGDLLAAAGKVKFLETSAILGKAWVTGGLVAIDGVVVGELRVAAHDVRISGRIEGDVYIDGVNIEIEDSAVITGKLNYRSEHQAEIDPSATIAGDVNFVRSEMPQKITGFAFAAAGLTALATVGGLLLLGAILLLLSPRLITASARSVRAATWPSLGVGVAALIGTPVLAAMLVSIVIGIPLAIFLIALYVLAMLSGILTAATALGRAILRREAGESFWRVFGHLALGLLILAVVAMIPILGALLVLVGLTLGMGAILVNLRRNCARTTA